MKINKGLLAAIIAIVIFLAFFLWGLKADAAEPSPEARIGLGYAYNHFEGAVYEELMLTAPQRHWYGSFTRIGGDKRHDYVFNRLVVGYRVNWRRNTHFSPFMRLGAAYFTTVPEDYISDSWAFDMAFGVRLWNILELEVEQHNSTAGRSDQNEGLDAYMIGVVLPFGRRN